MNRDKQIEEMARDIEVCDRECVNFCHNKKCKECQYFFNKEDCYMLRLSQMLVAKGYRKASEVAREIFAEIEKNLMSIDVAFIGYKGINTKTLAELKKKYESEDNKE